MEVRSIKSISYRLILDSHVGLTPEFIVELDNGKCGAGSSSQGETISIYEDRGGGVAPSRVIESIRHDGIIGSDMDQTHFDRYLQSRMADFGRNACFALSLAYFDAAPEPSWSADQSPCTPPRLCLNVLNGGFHAYTNPVLSDFSEFMIVPRDNDLMRTIAEHNTIQAAVKERLVSSPMTVVNGNPVSVFGSRDNAAPLEFLVEVLEELGLRGRYDLMIDASAGDLRAEGGYRLPITEDVPRTSQEMRSYWLDLVRTYDLGFLEDPFHEEDHDAWTELTRECAGRCEIVGDNLYSSDAARIVRGAHEGESTAAIVKPNQAGTVSATIEAVDAALASGLTVITSHRSISTESTFVCDVTCRHNVPFIKIGPLLTDYSSVVRLNRILRLSGVGRG